MSFIANFANLYFEFFKTGLFAVGGGLATIPFLYDMCDKYDWFTHEELSNMIAVAESTPGPIGINMATYTGFINGVSVGGTAMGWLGGIIATLGIITPSLIVILIIAGILNKFKENKIVKDVFFGLRPAVAGLITAAVYEIYRIALFSRRFDIWAWGLFAVLVFVSFKFKKLHPIVIILAGAVCGILLKGGVL